MMTDPVADMLTRIRNAQIARLERTEMPLSKLKVRIAELLRQEGYIASFAVNEEGVQGTLSVVLKYVQGRQAAIRGLQRTSRPGRRVYVGHGELPSVLNGMGTAIMSTSKGVMTEKEARRQHVGGEVLFEVW